MRSHQLHWLYLPRWVVGRDMACQSLLHLPLCLLDRASLKDTHENNNHANVYADGMMQSFSFKMVDSAILHSKTFDQGEAQ